MGKSSPSAPAEPDPVKTSEAQTASNKETALYNFGLNNPNVNTPLGSSAYTRTDAGPQYNMDAYNKALAIYKASPVATVAPPIYKDWVMQQQVGKSKGAVDTSMDAYKRSTATPQTQQNAIPKLEDFLISQGTPQYTQDIKLSPEQQQLYNLSTSQSIDLSKLASMLQGRVGETLNAPLPGDADFNAQSQKAQDAYYENQKRYLDPQYEQQQKQLDAKLANQGITMGSEAYNTEQGNFGRSRDAAYQQAQNNAILQGPQNAQQLFALSSAARQEPLNEFNALRSQSQVSMPQFQGMQSSSAQPTNVMQAYQNQYLGQQNAYNQQVASNNNMTSGLFNFGGALGAAAIGSDRRLKTNIERIGETKGGIPVYRYKYRGADQVHIGVMADEVRDIIPDAVVRTHYGYDFVDYERLR